MEPDPAPQPIDDPTPRLADEPTLIPPSRRRLVAVAEILMCSSVPTQLAIGSVLGAMGWSPLDANGQLSLRFVVTLSLADTVVLIALMAALTRSHGSTARALWLGERPVLQETVHGLLLIPAVFLGVVVLLNLLRLLAPWLHNVTVNPLEQLAGTPAQAAALAVVAVLAGGVREELQRAFLLQRFEQHLGGAAVGVLVLSAGFGLGHIVQGWDAVATTGAMGAFWAIVYLRRRSIVAPVVSHAGFNTLEVVRVAIVGP